MTVLISSCALYEHILMTIIFQLNNYSLACNFSFFCCCLLLLFSSCVQFFRNPMDCSLTGSSVCGISQAKILEWAAICFSRRSLQFRDQTHVSWTGRRILYHWVTREAHGFFSPTKLLNCDIVKLIYLCFMSLDYCDLTTSSPLWHMVTLSLFSFLKTILRLHTFLLFPMWILAATFGWN